MSIARAILVLSLLVLDGSASADRPVMTLDALKDALGQASEDGLTRKQATRFANACFARIERSTGDADEQITLIKMLGKVFHLAPIAEADRIREEALDLIAQLQDTGVPALTHLTRFAPRRFADTERERAAQFRKFDQFLEETTRGSVDEQTIATTLYLRAHLRIAASRRLADFTSSERDSVLQILQELITNYGAVKNRSGESLGEEAKAAVFENSDRLE